MTSTQDEFNAVLKACTALLDTLRDFEPEKIFLHCDQCGKFIAAIEPEELEDYQIRTVDNETVCLCPDCFTKD